MPPSRRRYLASGFGLATGAAASGASLTAWVQRLVPRDGTDESAIDGESDESSDFVESNDADESSVTTLRFEGTGTAVTDEFELAAGVTIVDLAHDGESTFVVELVSVDEGWSERLVDATGDADVAAGVFADSGSYRLEVAADGDWVIELHVHSTPDNDSESSGGLEDGAAVRAEPV